MTSNPRRLCDTHEMVVVHRVFRREFRLLPRMVTAVRPDDIRRAGEIANHTDLITEALHDHHHNEDILLWPKLMDRADLNRDIVERMDDQHKRLAVLLAQMEQLLARWRQSADVGIGAELAGAIGAVSVGLDEHLLDEETHMLPIVEQHITVQEWAQLGEAAIANMTKSQLLLFAGYILEEASPAERTNMLAKLPPPARIVFRLVGERRTRARTASLRRDLTTSSPHRQNETIR